MDISISFRHITPDETLKRYVEEKLSRLQKYVETPLDVHVVLSVERTYRHRLDVMFTLNGLGYIALLGAYFLPAFKKYHAPIRWLFIGYTAITIIAWFILGDTGWWVGWITKLDEIALIGLLFADKPA